MHGAPVLKTSCMNKNTFGYCILAGLLAIAAAMPASVGKYTAASRNVTVRGLCEIEVKADRAIWPIVIKQGGNSLVNLAKDVDANNTIVLEWLASEGISEGDITIASPKVEDQRAMGYANRTYDYLMTSVITVCTSDVDKVIQLQSKQFSLLNKGIAIGSGYNWEYPTVYEYTALNSIKPQMIEQATVNAREAADKFAKDSGSKVGKINSASQGQFSITDRDTNTPYMKIVRVVTTINYQLR